MVPRDEQRTADAYLDSGLHHRRRLPCARRAEDEVGARRVRPRLLPPVEVRVEPHFDMKIWWLVHVLDAPSHVLRTLESGGAMTSTHISCSHRVCQRCRRGAADPSAFDTRRQQQLWRQRHRWRGRRLPWPKSWPAAAAAAARCDSERRVHPGVGRVRVWGCARRVHVQDSHACGCMLAAYATPVGRVARETPQTAAAHHTNELRLSTNLMR